MFRAVALAGIHHGRHVRRISFQHDGIQWQLRDHLAQAQRLRPGGRAAQAEFKTELEVFAGFFMTAGEGMDDAAARRLEAFQRGDGGRMGAAYMQQGG